MDINVRMMKDREYEMIPIDEIRVVNSRNRDEEQFSQNVRSIDSVGLLKPIIVNKRHYEETKVYDLICGEGRFIAYQRLGKKVIPAEVVDWDDKHSHLNTLAENIARVPPDIMWFATEMKRMHDSGMSYSEIGRIVGADSNWVSSYIHLVSQGEERLIKGVEQGLFPMHFALQVARTADAEIQHVLMDAFDEGVVNSNNIDRVKKLIEHRMNRGRDTPRRASEYKLKDLKQDL